MEQVVVEKLLAINKSFYLDQAESFDKTRSFGWEGWEKMWQTINSDLPNKCRVVDIGCGNGRFGIFLYQKKIKNFAYHGLDSSEKLLAMAKLRVLIKDTQFTLCDVIRKPLRHYIQPKSVDLMVILALLHHIPSNILRQKILLHAWQTVKPGGWMVVSFWQLATDKKLKNKSIPWQEIGIRPSDVEAGDFLLPWQNSSSRRYCHNFTPEEIHTLLPQQHVSTLDHFEADGKSGRVNYYVLLHKMIR